MIKLRHLSNGVRVILEKTESVKSVSIGIWAKAGAVNENSENSGISHFIEHMMFKGTSNRTAKQIASDADRIAGQYNAFTGKEATCYYIKTLEDNIESGIDILTDMVMNSLFDKEEMDKERQVIFEEMKMIEDSPEDDIHDIIMEHVFRGNPLANSIIGTRESLYRINTDTILNYLKSEYTTDRIVVSIAGSFDEEKAISLLEDKFYKLNKNEMKIAHSVSAYEPSFSVKIKDIEQTHICAAIPTIPRIHNDYYGLQVLNSIFGGTMSSRLFQNIRESKGLAYSVYSMSNSYIADGYFNIYAGVSHSKVEKALEGIREELSRLKASGITADEIEIAKAQILGSYIYSMENTNSRMFAMGKNMVLNDMIISQEDMIESISKVSAEDINNAIDIICRPELYSIAIISDHEISLDDMLR